MAVWFDGEMPIRSRKIAAKRIVVMRQFVVTAKGEQRPDLQLDIAVHRRALGPEKIFDHKRIGVMHQEDLLAQFHVLHLPGERGKRLHAERVWN